MYQIDESIDMIVAVISYNPHKFCCCCQNPNIVGNNLLFDRQKTSSDKFKISNVHSFMNKTSRSILEFSK